MNNEQKIITHLHRHGICSSDIIAATTGIPKNVVLRCLVHLKRKGIIQKVRTLLPGDDISFADKVIFVKYRVPKKPAIDVQLKMF